MVKRYAKTAATRNKVTITFSVDTDKPMTKADYRRVQFALQRQAEQGTVVNLIAPFYDGVQGVGNYVE